MTMNESAKAKDAEKGDSGHQKFGGDFISELCECWYHRHPGEGRVSKLKRKTYYLQDMVWM